MQNDRTMGESNGLTLRIGLEMENPEPTKLTKHAPWSFDNFMEELNNPSAATSVLLHGLGVSIGQLPKSDPNATSIDKLYF
jgi:hypothetical protein